ncbi:MAG: hypothetical protein JSR72_23300 [Proteobacteria bacterium]|nr:hypothetical protein [Pseudomonadota bacterium]
MLDGKQAKTIALFAHQKEVEAFIELAEDHNRVYAELDGLNVPSYLLLLVIAFNDYKQMTMEQRKPFGEIMKAGGDRSWQAALNRRMDMIKLIIQKVPDLKIAGNVFERLTEEQQEEISSLRYRAQFDRAMAKTFQDVIAEEKEHDDEG